jgi:hypothetical protein
MPTEEEEIATAAAAMEEMTMILNETRPKHVGAGLWSGVQAIVGGGIGATGIAILTPVQGAVQGARDGGILGGTVGALEGTVAGVVGAVNAGAGGVCHVYFHVFVHNVGVFVCHVCLCG